MSSPKIAPETTTHVSRFKLSRNVRITKGNDGYGRDTFDKRFISLITRINVDPFGSILIQTKNILTNYRYTS